MTQTDHDGHPPLGTRYTFGAKPTIGAAAALKAVVEDLSELASARVDAIKTELTTSVKPAGPAIGLAIGAAVMLWLGFQGLLIAAGFGLAEVMPGWAAALTMGVVLILIGALFGFIAFRMVKKLQAVKTSMQQIPADVREDVEWVKTHLPGR